MMMGSYICCRTELIVVVDGPGLVGAVEVALGLVDVGAAEGGAQRFQTQAVGGQRDGIRLHPHGGPLAAADAHQAHALELRNSLRHARFGQLFDLEQRHGLGGDRQRQNRRVGGIGLAVDRRNRQARSAGMFRLR